jgi:hypothetical protein
MLDDAEARDGPKGRWGMPYQRDAAAILRDWREVERHIRDATPGTPEADRLNAEVERLRQEYHRLGEEALRDHQPALPPFPATSDEPPRSAS